jgi:hypothetical protein
MKISILKYKNTGIFKWINNYNPLNFIYSGRCENYRIIKTNYFGIRIIKERKI